MQDVWEGDVTVHCKHPSGMCMRTAVHGECPENTSYLDHSVWKMGPNSCLCSVIREDERIRASSALGCVRQVGLAGAHWVVLELGARVQLLVVVQQLHVARLQHVVQSQRVRLHRRRHTTCRRRPQKRHGIRAMADSTTGGK